MLARGAKFPGYHLVRMRVNAAGKLKDNEHITFVFSERSSFDRLTRIYITTSGVRREPLLDDTRRTKRVHDVVVKTNKSADMSVLYDG